MKIKSEKVVKSELTNYASLINRIFGKGTATFDIRQDQPNTVVSALNRPGKSKFKNNFIARLKRIKKLYNNYPSLISPILIQVNEIASEKNWQGAFAELSAYDHLNYDLLDRQNILFSPIAPDITLSKKSSLALELKKEAANLDGYLEDLNLYFDTKVLKDNIGEILNGIYALIRERFPNLVNISAEYDMGISFDVLQLKRKKLLQELINAIDQNLKLRNHRSTTIPELSFVLSWEGGVSFSIRTYSPFRHAKEHYQNIFIHAKKFLKDSPSLIVYVNFPWYNQVLNQAQDLEVFQRSYARRVFCQHKNDTTLFTTISPDFVGDHSIFEV